MLYFISKKDFIELLDYLLAKSLPPQTEGRCKLLWTLVHKESINNYIIDLRKGSNNNIDLSINIDSNLEGYYDWPGYEQAMLIYDL